MNFIHLVHWFESNTTRVCIILKIFIAFMHTVIKYLQVMEYNEYFCKYKVVS